MTKLKTANNQCFESSYTQSLLIPLLAAHNTWSWGRWDFHKTIKIQLEKRHRKEVWGEAIWLDNHSKQTHPRPSRSRRGNGLELTDQYIELKCEPPPSRFCRTRANMRPLVYAWSLFFTGLEPISKRKSTIN